MCQVPQSFHYCREDQANKYLLHELPVIIWFAVKEAKTDMQQVGAAEEIPFSA